MGIAFAPGISALLPQTPHQTGMTTPQLPAAQAVSTWHTADPRVMEAEQWIKQLGTLSRESVDIVSAFLREHSIGMDNLRAGDVDKKTLSELAPSLRMGPRCNLVRAIEDLRNEGHKKKPERNQPCIAHTHNSN